MEDDMRTTMMITAALLAATGASAQQAAKPRVLVVVSGNGADNGKTRPGFEMDELTQAWAVFADNGLAVDIASPKGGAVVADGFDPAKPYNKRFLADAAASAALTATKALAEAKAARYDAVFLVGGKGAMFDLATSADLKEVILATDAAGGVVGAVCHGPAAFMNLLKKDGSSFIAGRALTGFSNEEEVLFGKRWAATYPVRLEDGLKGAGARFSAAPMMLSHVISDDRLVTGQNPFSTPATAEAMVKAMGRTLAARSPYDDERGIALIGMLLAGKTAEAQARMNRDPAGHDFKLVAMWGYYRTMSAPGDATVLRQGLAAMELAAPHFKEPKLAEAITATRQKLAAMGR
jgi:putative intracellular protease/amidase